MIEVETIDIEIEEQPQEEISVNDNPMGQRGYSAYEVYLNNGGTLTESQWLNSLKGQDGKDGINGKDGADGNDYVITESDYNAIAEVTKGKIDIPTKTSDLTNDSGFVDNTYHDNTKQDVISDLNTIRSGASKGETALQSVPNEYAKKTDIPNVDNFITNTVNNLTNYYLKSETYTKNEVISLIGQIQGVSIEKVSVLPTTGETNKIYLVPNETSEQNNIFDEYIYVDNNWEIIGSTQVDLSNYYTKNESDNRYLQNESDPTVPEWAKQNTKPTYTASEVGALPDTTTIPTKTSDLTNDSNYQTESQVQTLINNSLGTIESELEEI